MILGWEKKRFRAVLGQGRRWSEVDDDAFLFLLFLCLRENTRPDTRPCIPPVYHFSRRLHACESRFTLPVKSSRPLYTTVYQGRVTLWTNFPFSTEQIHGHVHDRVSGRVTPEISANSKFLQFRRNNRQYSSKNYEISYVASQYYLWLYPTFVFGFWRVLDIFMPLWALLA